MRRQRNRAITGADVFMCICYDLLEQGNIQSFFLLKAGKQCYRVYCESDTHTPRQKKTKTKQVEKDA